MPLQKVSGVVESVSANLGQVVKKGQVLAAIQEKGLQIVDVSTRDPDLEDVFLNLTAAAA